MSEKKVNLRTVADRVGLAPCSVSAILNDTEAARAIPRATKERVHRAAAELNYRPNLWARSLRTKRTRMVAVIAPDFGSASTARIIAGAQNRLHRKGYLMALGTLEFSESSQILAHFQQRGIEGLIAIDSMMPTKVELPVASVELEVTSQEFGAQENTGWLRSLGEAAAETIIRQIETPRFSRRVVVETGTTAAYINNAVLAARTDAREGI